MSARKERKVRFVGPLTIEVDEETNREWLEDDVRACKEAEDEIRKEAETRLAAIAEEREQYEARLREAQP